MSIKGGDNPYEATSPRLPLTKTSLRVRMRQTIAREKNETMKRWLNLKTFGWTCTTVGLIGTIFYSQNLITPASVLWFIANSSFTVYNLVQEKPQIAQAVFFLVNAILNAIQLLH